MEGHVNQVHLEQRKKSQFKTTTKQLKVDASTKFSYHSKYLAPLFKDLSPIIILQPMLAMTRKKRIKNDKGDDAKVDNTSDFDKAVYGEKIKM